MSIIIYELGCKYSSSDILIMLDDDVYDLFLYEKEDKSLSEPIKIYILKPNYKEEMFPFLLYYIHLINNIKIDEYFDEYPEYKNWEILIKALNDFDIKIALLFLNKLKGNNFFYLNNKILFESIEVFIEKIISPLTNGFFYNTALTNKQKNWFDEEVSTFNSLNNFKKSYAHLKIPFITTVCTYVDKYESNSVPKISNSNSEKLYIMSAYLYQLAIHLFSIKQYQQTFLLIHRTLDFYLQAIALNELLLIPTSHGVKFTDYEYESKPVGLYHLNKCLLKHGKLQYSKEQADFFTWVNNSRNLSLFTHGVYSSTVKECEDLIKKTAERIKLIEGNNKWKNLAEKLKLKMNFENISIFDLEPSIDAYFTEVVL